MSNIIEFTPRQPTGDDDNEFYTLRVFKDMENRGEVVARIEFNTNITPTVILSHLEQLWWKHANRTADDEENRGRIMLQCNFFENTAWFIENRDIPKTREHIEGLQKEFGNMIDALISEGRKRGEYE